jgi:hypothetical protein
MEASREGTPTRLPGSPKSKYPVFMKLTSPRLPGRCRRSSTGSMAGDLTGQARNVAKVTTALAKRGFEQDHLRPSEGHGLPGPRQRTLAMDATTLQAGAHAVSDRIHERTHANPAVSARQSQHPHLT